MPRTSHSTSVSRRSMLLLLVAVGLLGAGYVGYRLASRSQAGSAAQPLVSDSAALVAQERAARLRLEAEVNRLRAEVDSLADAISRRATRADAPRSAADQDPLYQSSTRSAEAGGFEALEEDALESERLWFDEAVLLEAGFRADEAADLRKRREEIQMENLSLFDRASREGWLGTERFEEEAAALSRRFDELHGELGNDAYDWFLYASHRANRIQITGVFDDSPAAEAGLQPGDVLILYDGKRVFSGGQLIRETAGGRAGEVVRLEIERGGERRSLYVQRGPLGAQTGAVTRRPFPLQ